MNDPEEAKAMLRVVAIALRQDIMAQRAENEVMDLNRLAAAAIIAMVEQAKKTRELSGLH